MFLNFKNLYISFNLWVKTKIPFLTATIGGTGNGNFVTDLFKNNDNRSQNISHPSHTNANNNSSSDQNNNITSDKNTDEKSQKN